eukprot:5457643-Pyramimonas_sp.AAC.1
MSSSVVSGVFKSWLNLGVYDSGVVVLAALGIDVGAFVLLLVLRGAVGRPWSGSHCNACPQRALTISSSDASTEHPRRLFFSLQRRVLDDVAVELADVVQALLLEASVARGSGGFSTSKWWNSQCDELSEALGDGSLLLLALVAGDERVAVAECCRCSSPPVGTAICAPCSSVARGRSRCPHPLELARPPAPL